MATAFPRAATASTTTSPGALAIATEAGEMVPAPEADPATGVPCSTPVKDTAPPAASSGPESVTTTFAAPGDGATRIQRLTRVVPLPPACVTIKARGVPPYVTPLTCVSRWFETPTTRTRSGPAPTVWDQVRFVAVFPLADDTASTRIAPNAGEAARTVRRARTIGMQAGNVREQAGPRDASAVTSDVRPILGTSEAPL